MKNAVVTHHGPLDSMSRLSASRAIDGNTSSCSATLTSTSSWLQVDLKKAYLIKSVKVFFDSGGEGFAVVRVGSDLTHNGNDVNPKCGQPISNSAQGWTETTCSPPLRGRYISVQSNSTRSSLSVCELRANYGKKIM